MDSVRQDTRVVAPVALILEIDGKAEPCFTRNISQGGMFVVTRREAALDKVVKIIIARDGTRLETSARVVNAAEDGLGLRFVNPGPTFGHGIANLIGEILKQGATGAATSSVDGEAHANIGWAYMPDGKSWNWWRKGVHGGRLLSLSLDGAALRSRVRPNVDETVIIFLTRDELPDASHTCQAEVVRHFDGGFAVRFTEPSFEFRRMVSALRRREALGE